jgi:adenylate kinase family enzyme
MNHKKIYIIGGQGSGKSFLAGKLGEKLNISHQDLDRVVYKGKNFLVKWSLEKRKERLKKALSKKQWILEGAYTSEWINPIIKKADLILILDINSLIARKRVIARYVKREEKDRFKDLLFLLKSAKNYRKEKVPKIVKLAKKYKKRYLRLTSKKQVSDFVKSL